MTVPYHALRQSTASLFGYALLELFPDAQLMGCELNQLGFTYTFYLEQPLEQGFLALFEEKMRFLAKEALSVESISMMRENAAAFFCHKGQGAKAAVVEESLYNVVPVLKIGEDFYDYGEPPYVTNTSELTAFKLQKLEPVEGAEHQFLVTGTAFPDRKALKTFLKNYEEAKKKDHRLLGRDLGLYLQVEGAGKEGWFWLPKGGVLRETLLGWWRREHFLQGYQPIVTPRVVSSSLLKRPVSSGSSRQKNESLQEKVVSVEALEPLHALLFSLQSHSIQDLPVRYCECAELNAPVSSKSCGLFQALSSTVERAHVFCSPEQLLGELIYSLQFIEKSVNILGFECQWYLIPRGEKYAGTLEEWDNVLGWMVEALQVCKGGHTVDSLGAFSGPRIVMRVRDALGREWDGPFIEVNFKHSKRFGLRYQGSDGRMHTPYMMTRSMFGSIERLIAILVESCCGVFPLWLAPEQVRLLPISPAHHGYAETLCKELRAAGVRCHVDYRQDSLGAKIHAIEREKIPYALVLGDAEEKQGVVNVRSHSGRGQTKRMKFAEFLEIVQEEAIIPDPLLSDTKKLLRGV